MIALIVLTFWTLLISINLVLWFIYHIEHPFFEKYKINNEPWPWNNLSKKEWHTLLRKTLLLVCFNVFIMAPTSAILDFVGHNYQLRWTYDVETLPDT